MQRSSGLAGGDLEVVTSSTAAARGRASPDCSRTHRARDRVRRQDFPQRTRLRAATAPQRVAILRDAGQPARPTVPWGIPRPRFVPPLQRLCRSTRPLAVALRRPSAVVRPPAAWLRSATLAFRMPSQEASDADPRATHHKGGRTRTPDVRFSTLWHREQYCVQERGLTWRSNDLIDRPGYPPPPRSARRRPRLGAGWRSPAVRGGGHGTSPSRDVLSERLARSARSTRRSFSMLRDHNLYDFPSREIKGDQLCPSIRSKTRPSRACDSRLPDRLDWSSPMKSSTSESCFSLENPTS